MINSPGGLDRLIDTFVLVEESPPIYVFEWTGGRTVTILHANDPTQKIIAQVMMPVRHLRRSPMLGQVPFLDPAQSSGPSFKAMDEYENPALWKDETITLDSITRRLYFKDCSFLGAVGSMSGDQILPLPRGEACVSKQTMIDLPRWHPPHARLELPSKEVGLPVPSDYPDSKEGQRRLSEDYYQVLQQVRDAVDGDRELFRTVTHYLNQSSWGSLAYSQMMLLMRHCQLTLFPDQGDHQHFRLIREEGSTPESVSYRIHLVTRGILRTLALEDPPVVIRCEADDQLASFEGILDVDLETGLGYMQSKVNLNVLAIALAKSRAHQLLA